MNQDGFDELVLGRHPDGGHDAGPLFEPAAGADILEFGGHRPAAVDGQGTKRPEMGRKRHTRAYKITDMCVKVRRYASTV